MSLARVKTRCRQGVSAPLVSVEIHLSAGLPTVALVGFSEATVRDAKERVRSAILSSGFRWPDSRLTISISPAALQKTGAGFDLPIAVAILIASKQLPSSLADNTEFFGELSLDGRAWKQLPNEFCRHGLSGPWLTRHQEVVGPGRRDFRYPPEFWLSGGQVRGGRGVVRVPSCVCPRRIFCNLIGML